MLLRIKTVISLFLLFVSPLFAQQYYFQNYNGDDGLSSQVGKCLFQDGAGYIWVGTLAGLNRYDGNEFKIFNVNDGLSSDWIYDIVQDKNGILWLGTNNGLSSWDGKKFKNYPFDGIHGSEPITSLVVDSNNTVWCATFNGLLKYEHNSFQAISEKNGIPRKDVHQVLLTKKGIFVASRMGLFLIKNKRIISHPFPFIGNRPVYNICF